MTQVSETIQVSQQLSDEQLLAICEAADVLACQCPTYLVHLLKEVKEFHRYTEDCINASPEDAAVHDWLSSRAAQVELMLSQIIFELLQRENLIDEQNNLDLNKMAERARAIALQQTIARNSCAYPGEPESELRRERR
ncbi:MAG TPA: hypothetical protein V6C63_02830 [Allocoleopsis sp.]